MSSTVFTVDVDQAVRQYADMVYRLAVSNTRVTQDAEDVFQEVFVKLVRYKDKIEDEEHLKNWLIRVTINEARRIEGSGWKKNVSLDTTDDDDAEWTPPDEETDTSPEDAFLTTERNESILEKVRELPQKYREVIHLHFYEEMKITEISQMLGVNEATVKTRLRRAKDILEKTLKGGI
ncbi:RNA polymerase sigma-70 factor, ECF subfamily [Lachnospiraceae bacterium NE2001]|nr:RNA polymerase sigma-70 factor, ECF subfamily [Lachnospiraceae bacterium NE2001]